MHRAAEQRGGIAPRLHIQVQAQEEAQHRRQQAAAAGSGSGGNPPLLQLCLSLRQSLLRCAYRGLTTSQIPQPAGTGGGVEEGGSAGRNGGTNLASLA